MITRNSALGGVLVALLLGILSPAFAGEKDGYPSYYRQKDLPAIPVPIFCTGDPQKVGPRYLARANVEYLPLTEVPARLEQIRQLPAVFLIAREHLMTIPPDLQAVLTEFIPQLPTLKPTQLCIYTDHSRGRCRWTAPDGRRFEYRRAAVAIVAPTDEALGRAITALGEMPDWPGRPERRPQPNPVLQDLRVVCAVAGSAREAAREYARASMGTGATVFLPIGLGEGELERHEAWLPYAEEVYVLTLGELANLRPHLRARIPYDTTALKPNQTLALRRDREGTGPVLCYAAPTPHLLQALVQRSPKPPTTPQVATLPDLRHLRTVTVAANNLTGAGDNLAPQMERMLADALATSRLFEGVRPGGQDLKKVLDAARLEAAGLTKKDFDDLRVLANTDALLLAAITRAGGRTTFRTERTQVTANEDAFSETQPHKPAPEDRKGFLGGHKYSDAGGTRPRSEDPQYQDDLRRWRDEEMPAWERRRRRHEERLAEKVFEWKWQVHQQAAATVALTVAVFDLKAGSVVWTSQSLQAEEKVESVAQEQVVTVRGQGNKPSDPAAPPTARDTAPEELFSKALQKALSGFVPAIRESVLLPGDLPGAPVVAAGGEDAGAPAAGGAAPAAPAPTKHQVGSVLRVTQDRVLIKAGEQAGLKEGDLLVAVVAVESIHDNDGTLLETIERGTVLLRVQEAHEKVSYCVPVKPEEMAKVKAGQPVRPAGPGEGTP